MAYIDVYGRANGFIRINYTEVLNQSNATSQITITSVQVCSTNRFQYSFQPLGIITLGGSSVSLTAANAVWVGSTGTTFTFPNVNSISATFSNDGAGRTASVGVGPASGYNDFNVFCYQANSGNIEIPAGYQTIPLTTYTTDSASTVSATSPVTLGDNVGISINRAKTSYTHTLQYSFDNSSWTNIATGVATSYSWDTDAVSGYFSTATARTCYIRCITYNSGTQIGTNSTSINIVTAGSPTVSSITVSPVNDNSVIKGWNSGNIYVQGYTKAKITVSYSLPSGANITSCRIAVNGVTVSDSTSATVTTSAIMESGTVGITAVVTDSRGNSGSNSTTITVYPYSRPYAVAASAIRYSSNVNTEDRQNGTNISAKATIAYSSVNGYNSAGVAVRYKLVGGTYPTSYTTLVSGNTNHVKINGSTVLSAASSYLVQFVIYDALHPLGSDPTTIEVVIPTKTVTLHAKDGGDGVALGGYNTINGIELCLATYLRDKLIIPSSMYGTGTPPTTNAIVGQLYFQLID